MIQLIYPNNNKLLQMADIRTTTGSKGTTYQFRYPKTAAKTGYAYKTFATRKEALAFRENSRALTPRPRQRHPHRRGRFAEMARRLRERG